MGFGRFQKWTIFVFSIMKFILSTLTSTIPNDIIHINLQPIVDPSTNDAVVRSPGNLSYSSFSTESTLIDHFQSDIILQPNDSTTTCNEKSNLFFLVLIHSEPANFERRKIIRETWGSVSEIEGRKIKVFFLIGNSSSSSDTKFTHTLTDETSLSYDQKTFPQEPKSMNFGEKTDGVFNHYYFGTNLFNVNKYWKGKSNLQSIFSNRLGKAEPELLNKGTAIAKNDRLTTRDHLSKSEPKIDLLDSPELQKYIFKEYLDYDDIIQGNFTDTNENSIYKHLLGFKWIEQNCGLDSTPGNIQDPPFLHLKADDDVFTEVYHLVKFVKAIFGNQGPKRKSLVCDVVPSDAAPRGWTIQSTEDLTMTNEYPKYCNGMAYLMTSDLIPEFLKASNEVTRKLENDDIYIMGLLREKLNIKPFYLNLRYSHDDANYLKWLQDWGKPSTVNVQPLPYLFVKIKANQNGWQTIWKQLWKKTIRIHLSQTVDHKTITSSTLLSDTLKNILNFM